MAVPTLMSDLSVTAASNSPADSESPSVIENFLQAIQSILRHGDAKGADIASATTTNIGAATGRYIHITGTTTITGLGTVAEGIWRIVKFTGALTLTHNATSLILPSAANITTAANDRAIFISLGSGNWFCLFYGRASGLPISTSFSTATFSGAVSVVDGSFSITGSSDATKIVKFEADGLTTATTRTLTVPDADFTIGYLNIPQNSKSAAYTTVMSDSGKHILHPTADNNARTFTIDSNANVAYPVGTAITFINQINTVTIAITTDTMTLMGIGSTGSRTLAANGIATALKVATTSWVISGTNLS